MLNFRSINGLVTSLLVIFSIGFFLDKWTLWWIVPIIITWLIITALGSGLIGWNYHLKAFNKSLEESKQRVAITFDDGPHPEFTPQVLKLLKQYDAKATFFCIGKQLENYPDLALQILSEGHVIGNHTYSHAHTFGVFGTEKVKNELLKTNTIFKTITGLEMQMYRPAFGVTNPNIAKAVKTLQLQVIGWSKRSLDTTQRSQEVIYKRVTRDLQQGEVILLHDTSQKTVDTLEQLLLFLQNKKMKSVSIDTLFNIKAYA